VILRVAKIKFEGEQAMAADNSVTPVQWLAKQIEGITRWPSRPLGAGRDWLGGVLHEYAHAA
jgi:hypothetical protein